MTAGTLGCDAGLIPMKEWVGGPGRKCFRPQLSSQDALGWSMGSSQELTAH